jgi:hypothetical protein
MTDLMSLELDSLQTLRADPVREMTLLRETSTHLVSRITTQRRSYILKWFFCPTLALELKVYNLLIRLAVPTLPVYEQTQQALLLEDLQASPVWRLAVESDLDAPETGLAMAEWYRRLHAAGRNRADRRSAASPPASLQQSLVVGCSCPQSAPAPRTDHPAGRDAQPGQPALWLPLPSKMPGGD